VNSCSPSAICGRERSASPGAAACLPVLLLLGSACSLLQPTYTADDPGVPGVAPVEVTVDIDGNAGLAGNDLRRRIEDFMFDLSRDPTREASVYDAALEVEDHYRTQGYPIATVRYDYSPPVADAPRPAKVRVLFQVTEGPRVTVQMRIAGNAAHDSDELLALWVRRRSGPVGLGPPVFVEAQLRSFVEELRTFYLTQGRLDAVVAGPRIGLDLDAGIATVDIEIDEGHVHTIRAVVVDAPLREALGDDLPTTPEGRPCSQGEVQAYGVAVRNALRKKGYPTPRVEVAVAPMAGVDFANRLEVLGEPGSPATVASVRVTGNEKTSTGTILRGHELRPAERYDGSKVDAMRQRLYRTGLFRKVDIRETPVAGDPSRLDLDVHVEENDSRAIEFLGGYGSYEQLRGGLRLEDRNLLGTGRGLTLDNRLSMKGYSTELTLADPDFLATQSILTVSGVYFRREEPAFDDEAFGGTIAVARPLFGNVTGRAGYTYRQRTDPRAFTSLPMDQLVDYVEGRVFFELRNDSRDSLLFPQKGHAEFLSFERIAPEFGASVDLDKLTFRASRHFGVVGPVHLVARTEQSGLWPHEGSAQVPLQERWFNGGEDTVRSYREARLGPKDVEGRPIGGEYRNLFGAELRVPVFDTLEVGLFGDAGNVGRDIHDFSFDDLGYALGIGMRLLLPIGPVRLDAAWNPRQQPGDDEWVVHLSIGYPY
jgi:outer membrane protein insertion porin family